MKKLIYLFAAIFVLSYSYQSFAGDNGKLGGDSKKGMKGEKKEHKGTNFSGFITQASAMSITVMVKNGSSSTTHSFSINDSTQITLDGQTVKGDRLRANMAVSITSDADRKVAMTISANSQR